MTKIPRPSKTRTGRGKKIYTEEDVDQMVEGQIKMFGQVKLKVVIDIIELLRLKEAVKCATQSYQKHHPAWVEDGELPSR